MDKNLRAYMAEMLGTFVVVFLSAGAVIVNQLAAVPWPQTDQPGLVIVQPQPGLAGIALAAGLSYAAALAVTLPISGGYLNPAVTLMLWVFKRLDGLKTFWLIGVQLLGAALAGMLLRLIFSFREDVLTASFLGTPHLNVGAFGIARETITLGPLLKGIAIEVILTFCVTFAVFALFLDPRASRWAGGWASRVASLWVGLVLVAVTLVGFPLTGAAVNPARWFGPVLWEATVPALQTQHPFADHAIYWIGSILGALVAGSLYTTFILPPEEEQRVSFETPAIGSVPAGAGSTRIRAKK
jgi:aquaporin Z